MKEYIQINENDLRKVLTRVCQWELEISDWRLVITAIMKSISNLQLVFTLSHVHEKRGFCIDFALLQKNAILYIS